MVAQGRQRAQETIVEPPVVGGQSGVLPCRLWWLYGRSIDPPGAVVRAAGESRTNFLMPPLAGAARPLRSSHQKRAPQAARGGLRAKGPLVLSMFIGSRVVM